MLDYFSTLPQSMLLSTKLYGVWMSNNWSVAYTMPKTNMREIATPNKTFDVKNGDLGNTVSLRLEISWIKSVSTVGETTPFPAAKFLL